MARAMLLIDIKEYLIALEEKVDFFHDVDDETMDQMKEVVEAIKGNVTLLKSKIDRSEIVDNLDSDYSDKPLAARQGKVLDEQITKVFEQIPKVYDWAKQPTKPKYTANEVGADAAGLAAAVQQNLTTHKTDTSVHLQSGEREKWNAIKSVDSVVQSVKGSGSDAANVWTMTFSDGSTATFTVKNGSQGERGLQGVQGVAGEPFGIAKIYASVSAMNAGYSTDGVGIGKFVLIDTGNVEDEDNAKLYVKGANAYSYITDLSGAEGMQGPQGVQGVQGPAGSDGDPGRRGTGILTINSPPTADPSGEWAYRIALSTVLLQSEADEVLVGDTLAQSYFLYNVGAVDSSYVYLKARRSIRGATGATGANGSDYVITAADKEEIISEVKGSLGFEEWSFELEDGTVIKKNVCVEGDLVDGDEVSY